MKRKKGQQIEMFAAPSPEAVKTAPVVKELTPQAEKLLANFEVLAESEGGIKKLRELVLELAVRGNLVIVPTSSTQEDKSPIVKPPDGSAPLPQGWLWKPFANVATIASSLANPAQFQDMPHIAPDNIEKGTGRLLEYRTISEDKVTSAKHRFYPGQIIYSKIRPNLSKVITVDFEGLCSADMYPITPNKIDREYLHKYMLSQTFLRQVVVEDNRVAMPKVNQQQLSTVAVPLPPLAEQKRIVAKVDELMKLCDELETRQAKQRETGARLTKSALDALAQAEGPEELATAWERVVGNFEGLVSRADDVKKVRETVLSLAVRGRLVERDECDETIAPLPYPADKGLFADAQKIAVPVRWHITMLADVAAEIIDCPHSTPMWTETGKICVRTSQFKPRFLDLTDSKFVSEETFESRIQRLRPQPNDILYSREGGILGVACRVPPGAEICLGQRMMLIRVSPVLDPEFLELLLNAPLILDIAQRKTTGGAAPRINVSTVKEYPIPLPPLAEQKRIVAKVDQLMGLCDDLEAKLRLAEETSRKVAEALVAELLKA